MKKFKLKDMRAGWFVGNFEPAVYKTSKFEVAYKVHKRNEIWPKHYHLKAKEINCLIKGKMKLNRNRINSGDIFVIEPGEVVKPRFLEDCYLIVIKVPSYRKDKYEVV